MITLETVKSNLEALLDATQSECAAAIEEYTRLQIARAAEEREARDNLMRALERDRILGLIAVQLELLNARSVDSQALKALKKMILDNKTAENLRQVPSQQKAS